MAFKYYLCHKQSSAVILDQEILSSERGFEFLEIISEVGYKPAVFADIKNVNIIKVFLLTDYSDQKMSHIKNIKNSSLAPEIFVLGPRSHQGLSAESSGARKLDVDDIFLSHLMYREKIKLSNNVVRLKKSFWLSRHLPLIIVNFLTGYFLRSISLCHLHALKDPTVPAVNFSGVELGGWAESESELIKLALSGVDLFRNGKKLNEELIERNILRRKNFMNIFN